jgi:hypothetical protein
VRAKHERLTVLAADPSKDNVPFLVDLDVSNAVPAPVAQSDGHLLARPASRYTQTDGPCRRLDPEEPCKPVLLWLYLACVRLPVIQVEKIHPARPAGLLD